MGEERSNTAFFVNEDGEIIRNRKCPRCGRILSSEGDFCEFCGTQLKSPKNRNYRWMPLVLILVFGVLVIGGVIFYQHLLPEHKGEELDMSQEETQAEDGSTETSSAINPINEKQFCFDGIALDFNMNLKDIYRENKKSIIKRYERDSNWDDDAAEYYYEGYKYYLVDGKTAVSFNDTTQCIKWICSKDKHFSTSDNVHVGDLWRKMTQVYPNLKFYTDFLYYNHFTHENSPATIAYDETLCVSFVFYLDQFTQEQIDAIFSVSNPSGFDTYYDVNDIQRSIYQSICNSIKIDEIDIWKK